MPIQKWHGKRKGISLFTIPNKRIKQEKKDLASRWLFNNGTGWTVNNYSRSQKICDAHFKESCFKAVLQPRLGFSKIHFTVDMNEFLSRYSYSTWPKNLRVSYFIPQHQGHVTLHFGCIIFMTAGKGWYQMTSRKNYKILTLDIQTYQGKGSLDWQY